MAEVASTVSGMSPRRIIGFACYQAFVFFLLYAGTNYALGISDFALERIDLLFTLAFMVLGFALTQAISDKARAILFSRPLLYVYAVAMAAGSLAPLGLDASLASFIIEGASVGLSSAFLLSAWGRAFGRGQVSITVPEVFVGSLVAGLLCLLVSFVPGDNPVLHAFRLLPLASVVNIEIPRATPPRPATVEAASEEGRFLSAKVLAGTLLFGSAAGLIVPLATQPGGVAVPYYPVSMVLFGAFVVGSLTVLLSDAFGRGDALNKTYRLAVFVMMAGFLVVPWPLLAESIMPGESLVLAGYLGLGVVLASLFLVLAEITAQDAALSFSRGFMALFAGEVCGILLANALGSVAEFALPGVAGVLVLLSYIFLFTEQDFSMLSQIVSAVDMFGAVCARIAEQFGLSNRESEILVFALRGRTSERIAQELVISKSTVDTHLRRIYAKCDVHSRQELLDLAERMMQ